MVFCFNDEDINNNKSVIEDSKDNTEDESVLAEAPGEKAGLWPGGAGACFMNTEQVTTQHMPWQILKLYIYRFDNISFDISENFKVQQQQHIVNVPPTVQNSPTVQCYMIPHVPMQYIVGVQWPGGDGYLCGTR